MTFRVSSRHIDTIKRRKKGDHGKIDRFNIIYREK